MYPARSGVLFLLLAVLAAMGCTLPTGGQGGHGGQGGEGGAPGTTASTASSTTSGGADTTPPTVTATSPTSGAPNVPAGASIGATFSEALEPSTVTATTFTVMNGGVPLSGVVTYAGTTATFTPASALPPEGSFVAALSTGVKDLAGNALASPFSWSFTTRVRPTVVARSPENGDSGVALNQPIDATFSVAMTQASITAATFLVKQGAIAVSGTVTSVGTKATFVPTGNYVPSAPVTATITMGAKDLAGNGLAKDHVWSFQTGTTATQSPVALGLAASFGVLASDMVANTDSVGTIVNGDLGISPGSTVTNFPPGVINGGKYVGAAAAGAQMALLAAYTDASTRPGGTPIAADLAGVIFLPGLYTQSTAVELSTGTCTLDAQGDPDAVFVFQIGMAFGMMASTKIALINGAKAANVFWAVGAAVTLGANAKLVGTVLAATVITLGAKASVEGRLLARGITVTLDSNVITLPAP